MKKLLLLFFTFCGMAMTLHAQKTVSGKITDESGNGIPSASIVEKGTTKGTISDFDGNFKLEATTGTTLVVSSVGYTSKEISIGSETTFNIALAESTLRLDDVVVVGYGKQKKANLTGAVNTFTVEDLTQRQVSSTSQLLQGIAPGVAVWQSSGKPGQDGPNIRIRGIGSISSGTGPLVVIDGVVTTLDFLDANSIESMTVLKDAASTAIYGVRGANGVIVIKTKRSKRNGIHVSYNGFLSQQQATNLPERVSAIEHMELSNLAATNAARRANPAAAEAFVFPQALVDKYKTGIVDNIEVFNTDWTKELLTNSGLMQNHNIILDAGSEKASLLTSVSYLEQQGLVPNNSFQKLDIRMNPDIKLSEKLHLSGNFFFNQGNRVEPAGSSPEFIIRQAIGLPASAAGKVVIPATATTPEVTAYGDAGQSNRRNPLGQAEATGIFRALTPSMLGSVQLNYKPIDGLDLEIMGAREQATPNAKRFNKSYDSYNPNPGTKTWDFVSKYPGTNSLSESYGYSSRTTFRAQASYLLERGKHAAKIMTGAQSEENDSRSSGASRTDFINDNQPYLNLGGAGIANSGSAFDNALIDYFGRINYVFDDKYLLELNGCYSGTSRFSGAAGKQWDFFPSASAGWVFTKEKFLSGAKFLDFGKIRASWGVLGNQGLPDNYPFAGTYTPANYYFNNTTNLGFAFTEAYNVNITYEKSTQTNVGLELSFLKGKLGITAEYFRKEISDLILKKPIPVYVGLNNPAFENIGVMENKGWELQVDYRDKIGKLKYKVRAMVSDVQNKILSFPGLPVTVSNGVTSPPFLDEGLLRSQEGYALRSYFGYQAIGYFQTQEEIAAAPTHFFTPKAGDIRYADINGDGKVNTDDRTFLGNNFPHFEYSFDIRLEHPVGGFLVDLSASVFGVGQKDNYISGTSAYPFFAADFIPSLLAIHKDSWSPSNPNAAFPQLLPTIGTNSTTSSFWIRDASYWRLKNLNLGVQLPKNYAKAMGIATARLYVSGTNLFTMSKFWKGYDPELNNNTGEVYPLMRTFTLGINIGFK
jgi:TonB-linked SusC/RagA family outer membrane protein